MVQRSNRDPGGGRPVGPARPALTDGWVGTRALPGYRAGNVVARLADLPEVDPEHLYFHLLLLDPEGGLQDNHSGPCYALDRAQPIDDRSRFVRVVAELVRHAPSEDRGLSAIGQVLSFVRRCGVEAERLVLAAQLLDDVCSEGAVVTNLCHLLELSLGAEEASHAMAEVVDKLAREPSTAARGVDGPTSTAADLDAGAAKVDASGLEAQVAFVVRRVGKSQARRYLREAIDFELVPTPHILGV